MIMENLAERLFVDLKNLQIKINKPEYVVDGAKIGQISISNGMASAPAKQFTIFGKKINGEYYYNFGKGVSLEDDSSEWKTYTKIYGEVLEAIKSLGINLKFYSLAIPKRGVQEVKLEEFETVLSRYIKDYYVATDDLIWRWDILVSSV